MSEAKYQDCYVAFLDILGFKELLKNDDFDQIYSIFKAIKEFKPRPVVELPIYSEIKFHIMSDSIIVYVDASKTDSFISLTDVCSQIQMYLLRLEKPILVRGGIARGSLYRENDIIFGSGLSNAYMLENGLAVFPRIIFTEATLNEALTNSGYSKIWDIHKMFYLKDDDELFYIDFLSTFAYSMHFTVKQIEDGVQLNNEFYDKVDSFISQHLSTETNASVRAKYLWFKKKVYARIEQMPDVKKHFEEKAKDKHRQEMAVMNQILHTGKEGIYV